MTTDKLCTCSIIDDLGKIQYVKIYLGFSDEVKLRLNNSLAAFSKLLFTS